MCYDVNRMSILILKIAVAVGFGLVILALL